MDSFSSDNTGSFPRKAATASVIAPGIVYAIRFFIQPQLPDNPTAIIVTALSVMLIIFAGLILGIIGLAGMKRHGTRGILVRGLAGTVVNSFLVFVTLMVVPKDLAFQWHRLTASAKEINHYDKFGVQFSYNGNWEVREATGAENGIPATEQITVQPMDLTGAVSISLYPSTSKLMNLEDFVRKLIQNTGGAADSEAEPVTENIGGVDQPGLRLHFSSLKERGYLFTGTGDFYRLHTAQYDILLMVMRSEGATTIAGMTNIMASLKFDGGSGSDTAAGMAATGTKSQAKAAAAGTGEGNFISAMNRVDMVHDQKRNILYITSGDSVLRYQLATKSFLPPLTLGGDLRGIDIAPDNAHIAVADAAGDNGQVRIHVVDLETGNDTPASFTADIQESGTYSVAYGADGQIWISSSSRGSASPPIRKYNPPTRSAMKLQRVSQDTMLAASADRQCIGFAEADSCPGRYGRILYRATQLPPQPMQTDGYLYEIAINRDGSQLAAPGYTSMALSGAEKSQLDKKEILSAAYHPQRNYLFASQAGTPLISVYDTAKYSKVKDLDFGESFQWSLRAFGSGRLKLSQDGFYLFCTVQGGIRYMATGL